MMSRAFRGLLPAVLLLTLQTAAAAIEIRVEPQTPSPGDVVSVEITGLDNPGRAACRLRSKEAPFFPTGIGRMRALIGLTAEAKTGPAVLTVARKRFLLPDRVREIMLDIGERKFTHQEIRMPPKRTALISRPEAKRAIKLIRYTLAKDSRPQRWHGSFIRPAEGRLSSHYGHTRTVNRGMVWSWHKGLDIAGPVGRAVRAPNAGRVALVGKYPLQGGTVILDHGQGVMSIFMHLSAFHVEKGDVVEKGDRIADVGNTGFSTGSHLHWGVYVHGEAVDPKKLLDREL